MGNPIKFKVRTDSPTEHYVVEVGSDYSAAWYLYRANADRHAAFMNNLHANGRVAHGKCCKGEACDRDRINATPDYFNMHNYVVLCAHHKAEFPKPEART